MSWLCVGDLQGAVAPMFPFEDDENEYDDYGAVLHPDEFRQADGIATGAPFSCEGPFDEVLWSSTVECATSLCHKTTCDKFGGASLVWHVYGTIQAVPVLVQPWQWR